MKYHYCVTSTYYSLHLIVYFFMGTKIVTALALSYILAYVFAILGYFLKLFRFV